MKNLHIPRPFRKGACHTYPATGQLGRAPDPATAQTHPDRYPHRAAARLAGLPLVNHPPDLDSCSRVKPSHPLPALEIHPETAVVGDLR